MKQLLSSASQWLFCCGLIGEVQDPSTAHFLFLLAFILPLAILVFLCGISEVIRSHGLRVFLYEDGLIHVERKSHKVIPWQNVEAVWDDVVLVATDSLRCCLEGL